jgi:cell shape-determining protein MreC
VKAGSGDSLVLERITKDKDVREGDLVVTAASRVGRLPSLFPSGIPIGYVSSVGQTDTDPFKQIQVQSDIDLSNVNAVAVLVR